jgi:hypothetical protein
MEHKHLHSSVEGNEKSRVVAKVMGREYVPVTTVEIGPGQVVMESQFEPDAVAGRVAVAAFESINTEREANGLAPLSSEEVADIFADAKEEQAESLAILADLVETASPIPSAAPAQVVGDGEAYEDTQEFNLGPAPSDPEPTLYDRTVEMLKAAELGLSLQAYRFILFQVALAKKDAVIESLHESAALIDAVLGPTIE